MAIPLWQRWLERLARLFRGKACKNKARRRRSSRPQFEELETRTVPALVINPTFAANIVSDPSSATIESTINLAIQNIESNFADNVTVDIKFQEMSSGLGKSNWIYFTVPYSSYYAALKSHATTAADYLALGSLPNQTDNPVNGNPDVNLQWANAVALGLESGTVTGNTVSLNTSICNLDPNGTIDPSKYDLLATAEHEIDEVLGIGSALTGLNNGARPQPGPCGSRTCSATVRP